MISGTITSDGNWITVWSGYHGYVKSVLAKLAFLSCCVGSISVRWTYNHNGGDDQTHTESWGTGNRFVTWSPGEMICNWTYSGGYCIGNTALTKIELKASPGSCPTEVARYKLCAAVYDDESHLYQLL